MMTYAVLSKGDYLVKHVYLKQKSAPRQLKQWVTVTALYSTEKISKRLVRAFRVQTIIKELQNTLAMKKGKITRSWQTSKTIQTWKRA